MINFINNVFIWVVHAIGCQTNKEVESKRKSYMQFAINNLSSIEGKVVPDCLIYIPFDGDDLLILRDNIEVAYGNITGVTVAPWCENVVICKNHIRPLLEKSSGI